MGIKHFFRYFRDKFGKAITTVKQTEKFLTEIDCLLIDMNGLFHTSAQKIYKYGNFKPLPRFLSKTTNKKTRQELKTEMFNDVCKTIEKMFLFIKPLKRLILCVDGPAPFSKQAQQRQRRFLSARDCQSKQKEPTERDELDVPKESDEKTDVPFDTCNLTPSTKFLHTLTKYIENYLKTSDLYKNINVVFSNEKIAGEGEHKLMAYLRKYGNKAERFLLYGLDADLIMLGIVCQMPNFYILRDELYDPYYDYNLIDVGMVRKMLIETMRFDLQGCDVSRGCDEFLLISDFCMLSFLVGNDFLHNIPCVEIVQGSIDLFFSIYKDICAVHGHFTKLDKNGRIKFRKKSVKKFMEILGKNEKSQLLKKYRDTRCYRNSLLDSCVIIEKDTLKGEREDTQKGERGDTRKGEREDIQKDTHENINVEEYKKLYYEIKLKNNPEIACKEYLDGIQWILEYYIQGTIDWTWKYPFHYSPFASDISNYISKYKFRPVIETYPTEPFLQLLYVMPRTSVNLLPKHLRNLILSPKLDKYYSMDFDIDLDGCLNDWEKVVLLPFIDCEKVRKMYEKARIDHERNKTSEVFVRNGSKLEF